MSTYAEGTSVPAERSKAEIETILKRYGAESFASGWRHDRAVIAFAMNGRQIRFDLPIRPQVEFHQTPAGRTRTRTEDINRAYEQDIRERWRAMALAIKAKLQAVESGITTFEEEFLAHIVLPNGKTYGEFALPQIAEVYEKKQMPKLLLGGGI